MHAWKRGLICLLLLCAGGPAAADWRTDVPQARLLGAGEFTWFGFSVYSARLFGEQTEQVFEQPFALELTYKRNITRDALVDTSVDEIRRQGSTVDERASPSSMCSRASASPAFICPARAVGSTSMAACRGRSPIPPSPARSFPSGWGRAHAAPSFVRPCWGSMHPTPEVFRT